MRSLISRENSRDRDFMRLNLQVSWFQERSSWSFVNKRRELDCILQHKAFSYLWICIEPSNSIQTATFCQLQHFESETLPFARGLPEYLFCHVITSEWRQGFSPQSPALSVFSFFVSFFFLFIPSLPLLFPPVLIVCLPSFLSSCCTSFLIHLISP